VTGNRWAINGAGQIGKIESKHGDLWVGTSLTGGSWQSRCPVFISEQHAAHLDSRMDK